jgi:hypothetical protein
LEATSQKGDRREFAATGAPKALHTGVLNSACPILAFLSLPVEAAEKAKKKGKRQAVIRKKHGFEV